MWSAPWADPTISVRRNLTIFFYERISQRAVWTSLEGSNCFPRGFRTSISKETYSHLCFSKGGPYLLPPLPHLWIFVWCTCHFVGFVSTCSITLVLLLIKYFPLRNSLNSTRIRSSLVMTLLTPGMSFSDPWTHRIVSHLIAALTTFLSSSPLVRPPANLPRSNSPLSSHLLMSCTARSIAFSVKSPSKTQKPLAFRLSTTSFATNLLPVFDFTEIVFTAEYGLVSKGIPFPGSFFAPDASLNIPFCTRLSSFTVSPLLRVHVAFSFVSLFASHTALVIPTCTCVSSFTVFPISCFWLHVSIPFVSDFALHASLAIPTCTRLSPFHFFPRSSTPFACNETFWGFTFSLFSEHKLSFCLLWQNILCRGQSVIWCSCEQ